MSLKQTLAHRHVKRFYLARFISSFGNGMGPIALAFGILHLKNGSAGELGLVLGSTTVALLCVLPFGGVLADKYGRVFMCGASDIIAGLCLLVQVYYFHTGNVPLVALLFSNIIFGIMWGIFWPSMTGMLPALLPEENLQQGNAINQFLSNFSTIIGTALGGFIVSVYGSTWALGIDAFTFIFAGSMVIGLYKITPRGIVTENSMFQDLRHGWKVFISYPWIVVTVFGFSFLVMAWSAGDSVLGPVISLKSFNGAKSWATVIACETIGYLAGSLIGMKINLKKPMRFLVLITFTLPIYLFLLARPASLVIIMVAAFFWGITLDLWSTIWSTCFQRTIPRESLSRVSAYDALGTMMLRPVGLAIAAPLAAAVGVTRAMEIFSLITLVVVLGVFAFPSVRHMELSGNS
jgi:MFS family permease